MAVRGLPTEIEETCAQRRKARRDMLNSRSDEAKRDIPPPPSDAETRWWKCCVKYLTWYIKLKKTPKGLGADNGYPDIQNMRQVNAHKLRRNITTLHPW